MATSLFLLVEVIEVRPDPPEQHSQSAFDMYADGIADVDVGPPIEEVECGLQRCVRLSASL
jgi:hypothetical protein